MSGVRGVRNVTIREYQARTPFHTESSRYARTPELQRDRQRIVPSVLAAPRAAAVRLRSRSIDRK